MCFAEIIYIKAISQAVILHTHSSAGGGYDISMFVCPSIRPSVSPHSCFPEHLFYIAHSHLPGCVDVPFGDYDI